MQKKRVEGNFFFEQVLKRIETGEEGRGTGLQRQMQVQTPKLEDLGLIEILKWCMVSDCLFRTNR